MASNPVHREIGELASRIRNTDKKKRKGIMANIKKTAKKTDEKCKERGAYLKKKDENKRIIKRALIGVRSFLIWP